MQPMPGAAPAPGPGAAVVTAACAFERGDERAIAAAAARHAPSGPWRPHEGRAKELAPSYRCRYPSRFLTRVFFGSPVKTR